MGHLKFEGVKIAGISACVPAKTIENSQFGSSLFTEEELKKTIDSIGVYQRHVSPSEICTSDLCFEAASELLEKLSVNREDVNAVIFVSQTPDYRLPATACILQDKLGLKKGTLAFDINLGCSGYVYGLSMAFSFLNQPAISKVLLLVGDTSSKNVSPQDKSSNLLFGDAGSATLIEKDSSASPVYCSLSSDGSGAKSLIIEGGGYRLPSSEFTVKVTEGPDKNLRSKENIFMDGPEIFNFTLREIPKDIIGLLDAANATVEDIDLFFFHQANKFMVDYLARKLKIPAEKYPLSLSSYGNTSSASIPLTIVDAENKLRAGRTRLVLSGFGVGLSWGSMLLDLNDCKILPVITI
ncbi:MAG TPA: ketoacyl-ACP synthase III [Bacteroidales bacterium]|nr:ketoacyl-ACP synthase III [Bacteroidales bacterium]HPT20305.1 ketoacyl-ACP synthase III [Bacteroidales bacterium]